MQLLKYRKAHQVTIIEAEANEINVRLIHNFLLPLSVCQALRQLSPPTQFAPVACYVARCKAHQLTVIEAESNEIDVHFGCPRLA